MDSASPETRENPVKLRISALMTVYSGEQPEFLRLSLESVAAQTLLPDEFVIVKDGPLGEPLDQVIASFAHRLPILCVELPVNVGRGAASAIGVQRCSGDVIARIDSDDLCLPFRFELEHKYLVQHPGVDVVGGALAEFAENPEEICCVRRLPAGGPELLRFARFRSPINNPSAMFRRAAALEAGNFHDLRDLEDYHLWGRMLVRGSQFHNLQETLVLARAGQNMFRRRGGREYFKNDFALQCALLKIGLISVPVFLFKIISNSLVRISPSPVRSFIYRQFLRSAR